jgi:protein-disulfide isomerase
MYTKPRKFFIFIIITCIITILLPCAAWAASAGRDQLRQELKKLLSEEPDIILDILRENSEAVLDVAQQGSDLRRVKILKAQWESDMRQPKSVRLEGRPSIGPDEAPVTIAAFTDFTCAYCRQGERTLNSLYESYPGKIRLVYKSLPMASHPGAVEASQFMLAAYNQDKNKSWKLFHSFFDNREKILANDGHAFLRSAVMEAGLNVNKILDDAKNAKIQKILDEDEQDADNLKFDGTPSFLVNNIAIRGALAESLFRAAVDMALAEAEKKK